MRNLALVAIVLSASFASAERRKSTVTYGTPVVTGTFDTKVLTATVKRGQARYLACYDKARKTDAELQGTANVTFTIATDGKVTNVGAIGLVEDAAKCMTAAFTKLKFAKPKSGAVEVTVPLTFATMSVINGGAFGSLTGTGDVGSGFDDKNIYGGLLGNEAGEMNGGFGFGRSGFGPGGGGTGWGTIGTGRYGQIGQGSGTGSGYGVGGGRGGMRGRASAVPTISIGQPSVSGAGDLDKAIIRRYIKRNIQKLSYCYEKELLSKPALQGTVLTQFTIAGDGRVTASKASGVSTEVAACVEGIIKNIEFPKPKNETELQVNYPFTYRPGDTAAAKPADKPADKPTDELKTPASVK